MEFVMIHGSVATFRRSSVINEDVVSDSVCCSLIETINIIDKKEY